MDSPKLRHNRDFQIFCVAQGLSRFGTRVSAIAFPLLVLHLTGSPAAAGLVGFAEGVAVALALLPGGVIADRYHRRKIMLFCDGGCVLTMLAFTFLIFLGRPPTVLVAIAAVLVALFEAIFIPTAGAALRRVVHPDQIPSAISINQARNAAAYLIAPATGGFLFGVAPALPFAVDAITFAVSFAGVLMLRTSLAPENDHKAERWTRTLLTGIVFLWRNPYLRYSLLSAAVMNFAFTGVMLTIIISIAQSRSSGLSAGLVVSFAGLGALIGALLAPLVTKRVSYQQINLTVTWTSAVLVTAMIFNTGPLNLAFLLGACALLIPSLSTLVASTQILITPDSLQGRIQSSNNFIVLIISPLGSVTAGLLLEYFSPRLTFLVFATILLSLAASSITIDAYRHAPDLRQLQI